MPSSILGEEDSGFVFEYSESIDEAKAPEPLPEREYVGEVTEVRHGVSNLTGKQNITATIVVPVDQFPADYDPANAPDGARLVFFSKDLDDSVSGRWNLRMLCTKLKLPMGNRFRPDDLVGKKVRVDVGHRTGQDEVTYNTIKGLPEAVG